MLYIEISMSVSKGVHFVLYIIIIQLFSVVFPYQKISNLNIVEMVYCILYCYSFAVEVLHSNYWMACVGEGVINYQIARGKGGMG